MKNLLAVFLLMISVALPQAAIAAAELVDPQPIPVPANIKQDNLVKHIKRALIGRGWTVEKESAGTINAVLHLRSHVARVALNYSDKEVALVYLSSENLGYKEKKGKRYIHKNYLTWANNVLLDINKSLQLESIQ